ncbi:nanos homolog 1-like [Thrips palmi]|uniref:Nanos homolog 1-like n=1 Tax=Thrips palmi TaxID=161013 RepID=A0A6P8XWK5_THRPL|nr:nanos homolog 1-like [Thrips palmi]
MDPFRYHDSNEGPVPVGTRSLCRSEMQLTMKLPVSNGSCYGRTLSVPLVLPEKPGDMREVESSAANHTIRTTAQCLSPDVHLITTLVQLKSSKPDGFLRPLWPGTSAVKPCCSFCKKNGERPEVYMDHKLHEVTDEGKRVSCPILRSVKCPICGATGDFAHTISHCPQSSNRVSVALMLKSTARQGNGRKRVV